MLFKKIAPFLTYVAEGFWWGFVGACCKSQVAIDEIKIRHRERSGGATQIYSPGKMPGIVLRNGIGLLKLRIS